MVSQISGGLLAVTPPEPTQVRPHQPGGVQVPQVRILRCPVKSSIRIIVRRSVLTSISTRRTKAGCLSKPRLAATILNMTLTNHYNSKQYAFTGYPNPTSSPSSRWEAIGMVKDNSNPRGCCNGTAHCPQSQPALHLGRYLFLCSS